MKTSNYRYLRLGIIGMGTAYAFLAILLFVVRFGGNMTSGFSFEEWCFLSRGILMLLIGLAIAINLRTDHDHIFFALFLLNFGMNSIFAANVQILSGERADGLLLTGGIAFQLVLALSWGLSSGTFIYAMIRFPGERADQLYSEYFSKSGKLTWWKRYVLVLTDSKRFWYGFFPLMFGVRILTLFFNSLPLSIALNLAVMLIGLTYFRISYAVADRSDRSRLAWILWGLILAFVFYLLQGIVLLFFTSAPTGIVQGLLCLEVLTQCIGVIMSVFFAGAINAGLVVRRTIIYSVIFVSVIFLFSVITNLFETHISRFLHVQSDITGAFLSAALALLIQPLQKKLEKVLPKF